MDQCSRCGIDDPEECERIHCDAARNGGSPAPCQWNSPNELAAARPAQASLNTARLRSNRREIKGNFVSTGSAAEPAEVSAAAGPMRATPEWIDRAMKICFVGIDNLPLLAPEYRGQRIGGESVQQTLLARA